MEATTNVSYSPVKTSTTITYSAPDKNEAEIDSVFLRPPQSGSGAAETLVTGGVLAIILGCIGCCCIPLMLFATVLPLIKLIIGVLHLEDCPIQRKIPLYLIISGAVGIVTMCLALSTESITAVQSRGASGLEAKMKALRSSGPQRILGAISTLLQVFHFIWLIIGAFWIFGVWDQVNYNAQDQLHYCHGTTYKVAAFFTFLHLLFVPCLCCAGLARLMTKPAE